MHLRGGGHSYHKGSAESVEAAEQFSERKMMSGEVRGSYNDGNFCENENNARNACGM